MYNGAAAPAGGMGVGVGGGGGGGLSMGSSEPSAKKGRRVVTVKRSAYGDPAASGAPQAMPSPSEPVATVVHQVAEKLFEGDLTNEEGL